MTPIFKLPNGGTFFIGNIRAAASAPTLEAHGITHIVNAQDVSTENFHERDPRYTYLRFPIAHWWSAGDMNSNHGVRKFYEPLFGFVEKALKGKNVMVHCLAGAHRGDERHQPGDVLHETLSARGGEVCEGAATNRRSHRVVPRSPGQAGEGTE